MRITFLFIMLCNLAAAQKQNVSFGSVVRLNNFSSAFVDDRNVDVWLPPDYSTLKKYAVLYMHDGQMLFDSSVTWNKQSWMVAENMQAILKNKKLKECIVVGIWNNNKKRFAEYFPQKALNYLIKTEDTTGMDKRVGGFALQADNYLKYLVTELKPRIDSLFSTQKDAANTFIAGSSMGGLISLYAICEYPKIFGRAACLSTHFPILFTNQNNPFPTLINKYLQENLPTPKQHKIYFDYGTATLDSIYKPYQIKVDDIMKQKGFAKNSWVTKEFAGADHSEKSWANRLNIPLQFLLAK